MFHIPALEYELVPIDFHQTAVRFGNNRMEITALDIGLEIQPYMLGQAPICGFIQIAYYFILLLENLPLLIQPCKLLPGLLVPCLDGCNL